MAKNEFEKFVVRNAVVEMAPMAIKPLNSPFVAGGKDPTYHCFTRAF
jgi:hypothetical protein